MFTVVWLLCHPEVRSFFSQPGSEVRVNLFKESPWLCWSVLLPGTQLCRRHRWGWAACACWWTTSLTGCHFWPNALSYHSDWMRCPGAGPHADLSDDRSSTWVRGQSEITRKISNSTIRRTDVTAEQQLEQTRGEVTVWFLCPAVRGWDWYRVCHLFLYPFFSSPAYSKQGQQYFWFANVRVTQMC